MYSSDQALASTDDAARARLAREFPDLPAHIVAAVAQAYRRVVANPADHALNDGHTADRWAALPY